ncbi:peptidase domain-containing ABC transporter [Marinobacter persicus]|uniref:ATP-binding cassette, subfamily B, HlyB/CyaB n=1 Tax=Marinobacter persicus TaxID=930118 RepID=A0A2S6G4K4_9GAMM|nr:peptidase domain-containing ABC transporter [Marinobacter persicus]PPK50672.1 ATP-binding cassette, subfamily B, HlyB/CyaB [Marinobacter persicus]PPK54010.1 ATP-binding cassette, subfamily B, HlyB/CyaB [Marinobacter persicus]PPK57181.1 ATP-binding cassette, subfamily B, HlyB/CyaB [Marinobacter persicus]
MDVVTTLKESHAVWLAGSLCRFHRIPFDSRLFLQQHPPASGSYSVTDLFRALSELGLRHGVCPLDQVSDFAEINLPCIAYLQDPENPGCPEDSSTQPGGEGVVEVSLQLPILISAIDEDGVHYFRPDSETMHTVQPSELDGLIEPELCLIAPGAEELKDEDGKRASKEKEFGFRWFIPELLKHKRVWRDILVASLLLQLVGLATPLFTQVIIDKVVVHQTQSTLIAIGAGMVLAIIFSAAFTWVRQYLVIHTGNRIDAVLGHRVFSHLLKLPMPYFANRPTGTLVARIQGVETIREFVSGAAVSLMLDVPFMLVLLAVMFWYSWQLSLIAVGLLALLALLSLAVTPTLRDRLNKQFLLGARNQAYVTEYVGGMETVKSLQLEPQLEQRYGNFLADYLHSTFSTRQLSNTYNTLSQFLEQLQTLAILVVGALLVMQNDGFTIGMLVAFQMFSSRLSQPLLRLVGLYQEFQQANLAVKRLGDLMNVPTEPYALKPNRAKGDKPKIELENVGFRYSEDHPWLFQDLSYSFTPGKTTLVMGPSGSGKSTLAKLILGFYRPSSGRILLGGRDIRHFSANELRSKIGVVPQETRLFSGSVYENVQMANPLASFEEIVSACRWAGIHDVIEQLPDGYQTSLGENGVGLSGGQKQRIAIARALLKKPEILIFDEATSNLDDNSAEEFAGTVNKINGSVMIIFIAHKVPRNLIVKERLVMSECDFWADV